MSEVVLKLEKGRQVTIRGETWTVRHRVDQEKVIVERDGEGPRVMTTGEVLQAAGGSSGEPTPSRVDARELEDVDDADWAVAQQGWS